MQEIKTQSMIFMLAGFETTSTALGLAAYQLATNPEKQKKLHMEIDELLANEEDISYSELSSLPYLDMVFRETLRMYPIGMTVVNRECMQSSTIQGIEIPAGVNIQVDMTSVHHDAETWGPTDPLKFEPERFSPEIHDSRHPMAWIPFGAGPRNCVGLRLGMMEFKVVLARIMKKFEFVRCAETEDSLTLAEKGTITPKHGVFIKVVSR
ncbi:hypothetical protein CAPTEDRAFT_144600 [Capitella teleta]|uniref:Cytochrome P450 n=1 Tax=Capitella teleta TaxID=283909 RepID=R7TB00_CAPTE|nr:hypothetical protein CAPTEDRAFT_144600 [Capitella teleta]|eukprot:ELT88169.1 hypothetical protein CAPTEDRAFT_144600 [Capitella teleta]